LPLAAGANWGAALEEYPDEAFSKVLNLNLQRVFTLTQKLVPLLLATLPPGSADDGPWEDPGEWRRRFGLAKEGVSTDLSGHSGDPHLSPDHQHWFG